MEASKRNPFVLPTLMSNFNYAVNEVLRRMNTMGIGEVWRAIETLHTILPPSIFDEVDSEYKDIVKRVNTVTNRATVDFLAMVESNNECCLVLEEFAIPFFRKMYDKLYQGGYLEKTWHRLIKEDFQELEKAES